jgi:hypothetical protein
MVDTVPSSIRGKGKVVYGTSVDIVIEMEKDTEAGMCENGMRSFVENVIE